MQRILRWASLLSGSLLLLFVLFMLFGHIFGDANEPDSMSFRSTTEMVTFVLFPICMIVGLALAYKWELLGGGIAVGSLLLLFVLRPDLVVTPFVALLLPGLLYLAHAWMKRKQTGIR